MHRYLGYAFRWVCTLVALTLLCVAPAEGQAIPEEGFPTKPVFPETPAVTPGLHEECGPFLPSGEFGEECAGDFGGNNGENNGPGAVGIGAEGGGLSADALDPAWRTPPRLECPSAVFLEELEAGAIDCHAWDAAGAEHLAYHWEPIGGATPNYLENPRLIPEDAPNPAVVAPSSPQFETLESFLSEEGTQRYRYRLTATSRATGLSSWSEVEVFVLSSRPSVYCPLELEVAEGGAVALACEGADPLSFRMDDGDDAGGSPVLWEWEGLWGASMAPLEAADTPAPLFTAPEGSAGRTYHYVASMTTSSSGVPRTARRRVSVTVKAGEDGAAPSITCPVILYEVYENSGERTLECKAEDAPAGATYGWTGRDAVNRLTSMETATPVTTFKVPDDIPGGRDDTYHQTYDYTVTMYDGSAEVASREVSVKVKEKPDILFCLQGTNKRVDEGENKILLTVCPNPPTRAPQGGYQYKWTIREGTPTRPDALTRLNDTNVHVPQFTSPDNVDGNTLYYYDLIISAPNADPWTAEVDVTVYDRDEGIFNLACIRTKFVVWVDGKDISLQCTAPAAPPDATWTWTAQDPTKGTSRLNGADSREPIFSVPTRNEWRNDFANPKSFVFYYNVSVGAGGQSQSQDVIVDVNYNTIIPRCPKTYNEFYEGDTGDTIIGDCRFSNGSADGARDIFTLAWKGIRTSDKRFASGEDFAPATLSATDEPAPTFTLPATVDQDETYVYEILISYVSRGSLQYLPKVNVTVEVRDSNPRVPLAVTCNDPPRPVYAGADPITLDCSASGVPEDQIDYSWEAVPDDALALAKLKDRDGPTPTFLAPSQVDGMETFVYKLTVSAENAIPDSDTVTIIVLPSPPIDISVTCGDDPESVYAGADPIPLSCSASDPPAGFSYTYTWEPRDATPMGQLSATDIPNPLFIVPDAVDEETIFEYEFTASLDTGDSGRDDVTITVLPRPPIDITVTCDDDPEPVYAGADPIPLNCEASPAGFSYDYAWTAQGDTPIDPLSGTTIPNPIFTVPNAVAAEEKFEYQLTASLGTGQTGTANVTITVMPRPPIDITVRCDDPPKVYEGADPIPLNCEGAPVGLEYSYAWEPEGATPTGLLSATNIHNPTFEAPDNVDREETYEYKVTASLSPREIATTSVAITVLNKRTLDLSCTDPAHVYEGSPPITLDCEVADAPDAPAGPGYTYLWEAQGSTPNTDLLVAGTNGPTPTFEAPENVDRDETYVYRLTVTAEHVDPAMAEVMVTVLNKDVLALTCVGNPYEAYEGAENLAIDCEATGASGASDGSGYAFLWEARGATSDTERLVAALDNPTQTFEVPENVDRDETYEYLLTATAPNSDPAMTEVTVTILNKGALALVCPDSPYETYEGSGDLTLECSAAGAPGDTGYEYAWEPRGDTPDTGLLRATDIASPRFATPDSVVADETYAYRLTVTAPNTEAAMADVTVTVLDRLPPPDPTSIGVTASISSLHFGVQLSDTQVALDPLSDRISTSLAGPYHAGRMMLSLGDTGEAASEGSGKAVFIEMATPVTLRLAGAEASIALSPSWSVAESCEQLSSQSIGGLHLNVTLAESDCRLLIFGGELDLSGAPAGRYSGNLDVALRSGVGEETHSVEVEVTVVPAQRVTTIGPDGVRFDASREVPGILTEEQNISIYPDVAHLTRAAPSGVFELSNPSLTPLEVSVLARFGYTEATEEGREGVVEDPAVSGLGDLSEVVDVYPQTLILTPGERGVVRYGLREEALATLTEAGYAAFFEITSSPRQYVRTDRLPEAVAASKTGRVTMRIPGVYIPGERVSSLRAELFSLSVSEGVSLSATFLVEAVGAPFVGEVVAYDGDGRELGRRRTLVYTRSRVRVPLAWEPKDEVVFLRFVPSGSGRVSEPVSIPWNAAPRRDIGAAPDSGQTPEGAAFARKP